jgi:hypothetical protein
MNNEQKQSIILNGTFEATEQTAHRLLPALPAGKFINKPSEIDRFLVRIWPDGTLYFKGSRERVEEFLRTCDSMGIRIHVNHISLCG